MTEPERYTPGRRRRTAADALREWVADPNFPANLIDRTLDKRQARIAAEAEAAAAKVPPAGKERTAAALRAYVGRPTTNHDDPPDAA